MTLAGNPGGKRVWGGMLVAGFTRD